MTEKQSIKYLGRWCKSLSKECNRLRSIVDHTKAFIDLEGRGHTPNWKRLVKRIEAYEDAYGPIMYDRA